MSDSDKGADTGAPAPAPRQSVVRAAGRARRAQLTPAPDTDPSPDVPARDEEKAAPADPTPGAPGARGENDDRLKRDRPPHW